MNKTFYMIFMILLVIAFAFGMFLSLEAGETLGKSIVRAAPIFLVMFVFYKLRRMDIESKRRKTNKQEQENKTAQDDDAS